LPAPGVLSTRLDGILIPRIPVARDFNGLPLVIAALTLSANSFSPHLSPDCRKGIGNHINPTIATE
jgi:HPr kinase/phosphorylase